MSTLHYKNASATLILVVIPNEISLVGALSLIKRDWQEAGVYSHPI